MGESFTIQISSNLVRHLVDDGESSKKKTRKPKPKSPRESQKLPKVPPAQLPNETETHKGPSAAGWPLFLPVQPQQSANAELDAIRSVLQESEKVVEKLQKQEQNMLEEVTQRAKDLHEKEFKLPNSKPMSCLNEQDVLSKCYKEHLKDPLKCADLVKSYADCARRARQLVNAANN